MNEFFNSQAFAYMRDQRSGETNLDAAYLFIAQDRFNRANRGAEYYRYFSWVFRKPFRLLNMGEYNLQVQNRHYLGIKPVEIRDIKGTEGKAGDFDNRFRPRNRRTYHRWISIALARQRFEVIPPVDLMQIKNFFFVRDGHHRISVARAFGDEVIDANVTYLDVTPPLPWETRS